MNYTVVWLPGAEQELAALWLDPAWRPTITQAAHAIDQQLQRAPEGLGESRGPDTRVCFVDPLGALFRVRPGDRLVEVIHVWGFRS
jgi:hypothetical protein